MVDDKWRATVANRVTAEVESLTLNLVARIQQLGERYKKTVAALDNEVQVIATKVDGHLAAMGVG